MYKNPSERFGIKKDIADGEKANLTVFDLNKKYKIDPEDFKSMGRATPFKDWEVFGECMLTVCNGGIAYDNGMNIIEKK